MNPITLIYEPVSQDTVEALEFLLHEARRGELIGIAYGAMLKHRSCLVDTVGEACRNPVFALGIVCMLSADIEYQAMNDD